MKVSFVGNCQTVGLCWYIRQLNPNLNAHWISIEHFDKNWAWPRLRDKSDRYGNLAIFNPQESIQQLKSCDLIIYQKIQLRKSKLFNYDQIIKYAKKDCRLISMSSIFYDKENEDILNGMIQREQNLNIDVRASKIIKKHSDKIEMYTINHPNGFLYLEIVRELCQLLNWNFFNDEQYEQHLKEGFPFADDLGREDHTV